VLDEVEDLHDRGVSHLGQELPFGHRDGLGFGVTGMHQTLEDDRAFVDVVVDRQIDPAQATVGHAALDLVLVGDHVTRAQLGQERECAAAVGAQSLRDALVIVGGAPDRPAAIPAEPLRLGHYGIDHQCGQRIDLRYPRDLHQPAAEPAGHRHRSAHGGRMILDFDRLAGDRIHLVVLEAGPIHRLGGHRPHRRHRVQSHFGQAGWLGADIGIGGFHGAHRRVFISRSTSEWEVPAPGRAPSTTVGTGCTRCRRCGSAPECR
jgi:hypothetical protein